MRSFKARIRQLVLQLEAAEWENAAIKALNISVLQALHKNESLDYNLLHEGIVREVKASRKMD